MSSAIPGLIYFNDGVFVLFFFLFLSLFFSQDTFYQQVMAIEEERKAEKIWAMFVFWNLLSGKSLSKLSCVYLSLEKLVNGEHFPVNREHFPVNGKHFPVNEKHFRVKEKFGFVSRKVFSLWLCLFSRKWFPENHFPNFPVFVCH